MVFGRPLLYLSLPAATLILGILWYRRRNRTYYKSKKENDVDNSSTPQMDNSKIILSMRTPDQSIKAVNKNESLKLEDENSATKVFGKSTPIKILQTGSRVSPENIIKPLSLDTQNVRTKHVDEEHETLQSLNEDIENLCSVNLPDSVDKRKDFCSRNVNCNNDKPVIIKATTLPKISPENSFLESQYGNPSDQKKDRQMQSCQEKINLQETAHESDKLQLQIDESRKTKIEIYSVHGGKNDATSPSLSLCSLQSGDSGKGSSLPRSEATRGKVIYEFFYPVGLLGYFQGRHRTFLNKIKTKTNADVSIRRYPYSSKVRVCVIEGHEAEINSALEMIRQHLPAKQYPNFTMQRIHYAVPHSIVPLSTQNLLNLQLNLIEGINNDVVVSTVVSGNHLFVQHPLHPTYPSLDMLQQYLNKSYTNTDSPLLPCIEISAVCVLQVNNAWYRVQIIEQDPDHEQRCVVKLLDFGGYVNVHFNELRQIRSDFMGLPFQATECILSNIESIEIDRYTEAAEMLCKLTRGIVLQAQVAGYNSQNLPEIYLFACLGPNNIVFINKELVARNHAKWVDLRE